jgi:hypothetical protein
MKKYEQLESQIQELQAEVERLKQEEASNKLPRVFKIDDVKKLIDTGELEYLEYAFDWSDTPQGYGYWYSIANAKKTLTDKDIIQLQKWVIMYLEQNQK